MMIQPISSNQQEAQKKLAAESALHALINRANLTMIERSSLQKLEPVGQENPLLHVGLGTGSTMSYLIESLNLYDIMSHVKFYSTSRATHLLAQAHNIPIFYLKECSKLDICIDGADQVDPSGNIIKGAGGALTREKIAAQLAQELWIVVDESKRCAHLSLEKIPLEIIPDSLYLVKHELALLGFKAVIRMSSTHDYFVTDNSNWILDITVSEWRSDLHALGACLKSLTGVVEHGLFLNFPIQLYPSTA